MIITTTTATMIRRSIAQTSLVGTVSRAMSTKVERGILFSIPCIPPEETEQKKITTTLPQSPRIEKGLLFSVPCLDMNEDGAPRYYQDADTNNKPQQRSFLSDLVSFFILNHSSCMDSNMRRF
mmetsp:Transcript_4881/g.7106  ORF Transcript_4881/g.7106 Transcript_4881/m.7106 type:complete len:123 (+) Transcript_4881:90-458(+)